MDRTWVDSWLKILLPRAKKIKRMRWTLFDPTPDFYYLLKTGEENDLQAAAARVSHHLELAHVPFVTYEWGLKLKPEAAGQIKLRAGQQSSIQIPLLFVGRSQALGSILAHELTHQFMISADIKGTDQSETELLTDLMSITMGLGKIVLNGLVIFFEPNTNGIRVLGYLDPALSVHAYNRVNQYFHIPNYVARESLITDALRMLEEWA